MNFDPMVPIWLQVATDLKRAMANGKLEPGAKLPSGRDLALRYGINPKTAARIYQELEREGICETRRGMGTFVTGDAERIDALRREMAQAALRRFREEMQGLGFDWNDVKQLMEQKEKENASK